MSSILCIFTYSVQMRENADQNNREYDTFYAMLIALLQTNQVTPVVEKDISQQVFNVENVKGCKE